MLIHLAHGLIARSQRPDPRLLHEEISSTALPARLVDVGLDKTQSLCLVNTAGQTGFYVALSYCCYPQGSSETQLTKANMSRLVRSIEPSDLGRCAMDAIELTRSLGVRYIWIGGLCVVQDDHEDRLNAMSRVSDIYRSAILTVAPVGTYDETVDYCIDSSVLGQPFSIFLDWSRPTIAKSCSARLFTRDTLDLWSACRRFVHGCFAAAQILESDTAHEDISDSDRLQDAEAVQLEVDATDTKHDEARHAIFQGVHYAETGKDFEALALFLKARELVGAFQLLTPRSWKMYAEASANIGLVYQKQHLLAMALDITEGSLAVQSKLPIVDCNTSLE